MSVSETLIISYQFTRFRNPQDHNPKRFGWFATHHMGPLPVFRPSYFVSDICYDFVRNLVRLIKAGWGWGLVHLRVSADDNAWSAPTRDTRNTEQPWRTFLLQFRFEPMSTFRLPQGCMRRTCACTATGSGTCLIRNSNRASDLYFRSSRTIHRHDASALRLLVRSSADVRAETHIL